MRRSQWAGIRYTAISKTVHKSLVGCAKEQKSAEGAMGTKENQMEAHRPHANRERRDFGKSKSFGQQ